MNECMYAYLQVYVYVFILRVLHHTLFQLRSHQKCVSNVVFFCNSVSAATLKYHTKDTSESHYTDTRPDTPVSHTILTPGQPLMFPWPEPISAVDTK